MRLRKPLKFNAFGGLAFFDGPGLRARDRGMGQFRFEAKRFDFPGKSEETSQVTETGAVPDGPSWSTETQLPIGR